MAENNNLITYCCGFASFIFNYVGWYFKPQEISSVQFGNGRALYVYTDARSGEYDGVKFRGVVKINI